MSAGRRVSTEPSWVARWSLDHLRAMTTTLDQLGRRPFGTLLTALVIGITLALPAGLATLLHNLDVLTGGLQGSVRASLFLRDNVDEAAGTALGSTLRKRPGVSETRYVSRAEALAEFKAHAGFGEALDILQDNPLPAVIIVTPIRGLPPADVDALFQGLSNLPEVESVMLDRDWLRRLHALLALVEQGIALISAVLGAVVLIVIGNTIRLDIESRREEVVVLKLIGASDAFIRRPFLYTGLWYGFAGAILACVMVGVAGIYLGDSARQFAGLYGVSAQLNGMSGMTMFGVFAAALGLGWFGALWTVQRHLNAIEPN